MNQTRSIKDEKGTVWCCELTPPICESYASDSSIEEKNIDASMVTLECRSSDGKTLTKLVPCAPNDSIDNMDESWLIQMIEEAKKEAD